MQDQNRKLSILNLAGELPEVLTDYFSRNSIELQNAEASDDGAELTHILCHGNTDFSLLAKNYQTIKKDIKLIALSSVKETQDFLWANGKLVYDEKWLETPIGEFILDKFFLEFGGIEIKDSYPKFNELGKFNILNPFNSGEYTDIMVYEAYQNKFNGLLIKTYFDHLLMYLIGLKNKNKAGIPFEVSYGSYEGVFALQVHFVITDITLTDISSCLADAMSDKPSEYALGIALNASSFFEFTHLNQVKKAVLTAFWLENDIRIGHHGLMFTDIDKSGSFLSLPVHETDSWTATQNEVEDLSELVKSLEGETSEGIRLGGKDLNQIVAEKISSDIEIEKVKQIINGDIAEKEITQLIEGLKEELTAPTVVKGKSDGEERIKISSKDKYDDIVNIVNIVKGKIEEEKDTFLVKGSKGLDIDDFVMRVSSGLGDKIKGDSKLKTKLLTEKLPERMKSSFFDFAKKLNKTVDDVSVEEMEQFKNIVVPDIISEVVEYDENPTLNFLTSSGATEIQNFFKDFKSDLLNGISEHFKAEDAETALNLVSKEDDILSVKEVVKNSLQKSLKDHFHLEEKTDVTKEDEALIVKTLSTTLKEDESKFKQIFSRTIEEIEAEKASKDALLFKESGVSGKEAALEEKLKLVESNNLQLKKQMESLRSELKSTKDLAQKAQAIAKAAVVESRPKLEKMMVAGADDSKAKDALIKQIQHSQQLSREDANKLAELHEKEKMLISEVRSQEINLKKMQPESTQKEALMQELDKAQRGMRAKELVLEKAKDSIANVVGRKDQEIQDLKHRLDQMTKSVVTQAANNNVSQINDLEKKNMNLEKMLDVYKNKIQALATNINRQSGKENDNKVAEENKKLTMVKNQLTNQVDTMRRDVKRLEEKLTTEQAQTVQFKKESQKLQQELKEKEKMVAAAPAQAEQSSERKVDYAVYHELQIQLETKIKDYKTRVRETEAKLAEALKLANKQAPVEDSKGKTAQLEQSLKRLTQEVVTQKNALNEAKKEANKIRSEKTAIQNQLDRINKEYEKLKGSGKKSA